MCSCYGVLFLGQCDLPMDFSDMDTSWNAWNRLWGSSVVDTGIKSNNMKYTSPELYMIFLAWPLYSGTIQWSDITLRTHDLVAEPGLFTEREFLTNPERFPSKLFSGCIMRTRGHLFIRIINWSWPICDLHVQELKPVFWKVPCNRALISNICFVTSIYFPKQICPWEFCCRSFHLMFVFLIKIEVSFRTYLLPHWLPLSESSIHALLRKWRNGVCKRVNHAR